MRIKLLDWEGFANWVDVPDDTQEVSGVILSGDMVMERPIHADASDNRFFNFYDSAWVVKRKDFDKLNAIEKSYDVLNLCQEDAINRDAFQLANRWHSEIRADLLDPNKTKGIPAAINALCRKIYRWLEDN